LVQLADPLRWTSTTKRKSSGSILAKLLSRSTPALLINMSTRPQRALAASTIATIWSYWVTLPPLENASPPAAVISSTTLSAASEWPVPSRAPPRSLTTTFAPRRASSSA
jgi:hypothetical protein